MRIAHIVSYIQPEFGYEEYFSAREQAALGHEVHVITSDRIFPFNDVDRMLSDIGSPYKDRMRPLGTIKMEGFMIHRQKTSLEALYDYLIYKGVGDKLTQIKPDVVHAHGLWQWGSYQAARWKERLGYKLILDEHAYNTTYDMERTLRNWLLDKQYRIMKAPFARYNLKRADDVVVVLRETERFLRRFYGVKRMNLIPLGVDQKRFRMREKARERIRGELGITDGILLITAGRLDRAKKLELFIEAFKRIKGGEIKFILIGRGDEEYLEELKRIADDRVIFMGFKNPDALADLYSASDIGLWGKESITIREAMGCNLPIIMLDSPNPTDILKWGNGILVAQDPKEIRSEIEILIGDPERRSRMGNLGRKAVVKNISVRAQAKRLLEVYERALSS